MLHYMWNFKPQETKKIPSKIIEYNKKFIQDFNVHDSEMFHTMLDEESAYTEFPELKEVLSLIPQWIMKADLGRLLIIYYKGGFYCDVDCFIKKEIPLENHQVYLFQEKMVSSLSVLGNRECKDHEKYKQRIANYFFGTRTCKNEFIKRCIMEAIRRLQLLLKEKNTVYRHTDILWCCGPDVITTIYHQSDDTDTIQVYDESYLHHICLSSWR